MGVTYSYEKRMEFIKKLEFLLKRSNEELQEGNMEGSLYYLDSINNLRKVYGYEE